MASSTPSPLSKVELNQKVKRPQRVSEIRCPDRNPISWIDLRRRNASNLQYEPDRKPISQRFRPSSLRSRRRRPHPGLCLPHRRGTVQRSWLSSPPSPPSLLSEPPKTIMMVMGVKGLTLYHLKNHHQVNCCSLQHFLKLTFLF